MPSFENPDGSFLDEAFGGPVAVTVSASGATIAMKNSDRSLYVNNTGTYAALTIKLPRGVDPGEMVQLAFANPITALTVQTGTGGAIATAPTSGAAGNAVFMRYVSKAIGYVRWK